MRLERLEIHGFKSFSDRAELAFDQGVTAIVGPNGCGKSNVADAITWVMGEQSAKSLRGDRMEDVIFSGSDARKPGATAEVRLRLSGLPIPLEPEAAPFDEFRPMTADGDGNGHGRRYADGNGNGHGNGNGYKRAAGMFTRDVEVTRRLYRSGESEYLIDGEVCRLRDIHELLMDTGLGAKAYAIIEQGKIGMILSSRPADRRQLIDEAAGITKYRSRRRAAELKLEAAEQNLTRIDDIVFEVEKQRSALKRQAAKARRYRRLREELRRWEKVLLVRRYRELSRTIETARARLADAREREAGASARVAEVEADLARMRIEQAEADSRAARIREDAHATELDINRRQQQQEFERRQAAELVTRAEEIGAELRELEVRREPTRLALSERRRAAAAAEQARDAAASALAEAQAAHASAQQQIEGLEADVEAARSSVYAALNSATALRHAMEHAAAQRDRVAAALGKLDVERDDLSREIETVEGGRRIVQESLARARAVLEQIKIDSAARESELLAGRAALDGHLKSVRALEQELARNEARLASLVELEASRAEFGDAARMVLVQADAHVGQRGALADYIDVDRRYERAVEACLGDLLQHVIVEHHAHAAAGLALVREHEAGRCGFVVIEAGPNGHHREPTRLPGVVSIPDVIRIFGPHASTIQHVVPEAYIAETLDAAVAMARQTAAPVATLEGDLVRGPHLVSGGTKVESRGILTTKREIRELRQRIAGERTDLARLGDETVRLEVAIAQATSALTSLSDAQHRQDMVIVSLQAEAGHASEEAERLNRKVDVIALERRQAEEERVSLDARYAEAASSITRLFEDQRRAETVLSEAQCQLMTARETVDVLAAAAAETRAAHAAMIERASALAAEVARLEDLARDVEDRIAARASELEQVRVKREGLIESVAHRDRLLDEDARALEARRQDVRTADQAAADVRVAVDGQDGVIRDARQVLEQIRAQASDFDVARATAESDMGHLVQLCAETVQSSLVQVVADVELMEQSGEATPDAAAIKAEEPDTDAEEPDVAAGAASDVMSSAGEAVVVSGFSPTEASVPFSSEGGGAAGMTAEEAINALKEKIDRLGPVNMMAIEQFDELEARHTFLTTQRRDLIDSIAQTTSAIERIDETSKTRFNEAFSAIQHNLQHTFSTLFGGGRAGLTLLDENDPLESGIDIVASPPGKRLQNVQLLSGGEKALTAIALMFAIFQYKPSPFCLLDEIDAPLDDANVARFVEMLQGMLDRTQFILITHNRRTMEIANRLYGVTMEEPGVSKLISVQLN